MARYAKVDRRIWNDARFRSLSERGKLVFLFALTHPSLTMLGAMRATVPGLAAELEMPSEAFAEAFGEALSKGIVKHDPQASCLWFPNFAKYNKPESPNVIRAWPDAFDLIPECGLKWQLLEQLKTFVEGLSEGFREAFAEGFGKTSERLPEGLAESVTVTGTVQEISSDVETSGDRSQLELVQRNTLQADKNAAVSRVFAYYLEKTGRESVLYAFTPDRKKKGLARLEDCLKKTGGDIEKAVDLMALAVDALAASDWHMGRDSKTQGKMYREWDDHLFGSYKRMEGWWNAA
jgi:hypothetical protein